MKTAYELAMERLNEQSPTVKLTKQQKTEIAEIDSLYDSKIAERELALGGEIDQAREAGDYDSIATLDQQLTADKNKLETDREARKEAVRQSK